MNILRTIKGSSEAFNGAWLNALLPKAFVKQFSSKLEQKPNLFFNDEVQKLLQNLTKTDYDVIFRTQKLGNRVVTPQMKFMTEEELEDARKEASRKAQKMLQMPPVLPPRTEINEVLARDSKLENYTSSKYIFTDISFGKNDRDRIIVVRDADGTLRKARWTEREHCNEIYFPRPGRKLRMPKMFKPPYFEEVLNNGYFQFILNRACVQFEPDDPIYINITQTTYDRIAEAGRFQEFESTRHFGSMIYYYTDQEKLSHLLTYYLNYDRLEDIIMVIRLHSLLHPGKQYSKLLSSDNKLSLIKEFIAECYPKNVELELALKSFEEYQTQPKSEVAL